MSGARIAAAVCAVALVAMYAGASGYWVQTNTWWLSLKRPGWQPPDLVFGLIWPYNFTVLGIAMVVVAQRLSARQVATTIGVFAISVAAATLWSYWFYGSHALGPAFAALVVAAVATAPVLYSVFSASTLLGWLLVPYQVWIVIAASLAWGYWHLN